MNYYDLQQHPNRGRAGPRLQLLVRRKFFPLSRGRIRFERAPKSKHSDAGRIDASMSVATPVSALNPDDPGDETAKKYRYQYAYGVILWTASFRGQNDYVALWCEQHEDFLGQVADNKFDGYQIKTRKNGAWEWNDDAVIKSIKRFVGLDEEFVGQMREFIFVSNAECSSSEAVKSIHLAPITVLKYLQAVPIGPYPEFCEVCLTTLAEKTECNRPAVHAVLCKTRIIVGPPEQAFEAEINQNHLPHVEGCGHLVPKQLAELLESLMSRVWRASSKASQDPSRHHAIVNGRYAQDPQLLDKRIPKEAFGKYIEDFNLPRFEYLRRFQTVKPQAARAEASILQQKMAGAGLTDYFDGMQRQTISTERQLFELQAKDPERATQIISQVESVVLRVCDDAHLKHAADKSDFGMLMMRDVNSELKTIAETKSDEVHRQPYGALLGMCGLLAEECKVWWSKRFELEDKK
jgi:hypothetical protein